MRGESNSKAPESFVAPNVKTESEVMETITPLPAATSSINLETVSATPLGGEEIIATLPLSYRESLSVPELIQEEKEEKFSYDIPENRRLKFKELCEQLEVQKKPKASDAEIVRELEIKLKKTDDHSWESIDSLMRAICKKHGISPKKLHDDFKNTHGVIPDVWVETNIVKEQVKSPMEELAEMIPGDRDLTAELTEEQRTGRVINLEKQVESMRKMILEMGQGTIVHGLGHMSAGSGEVNLNRMDDVDVRNIQDGSTLIWDEELQKWIPSGTSGSQIPGGNQDIINKINNLESALISLQNYVQTHTHGGGETPGDHGGGHETGSTLIYMEDGTDITTAETVDFDDDTHAYIAAEQSVDLDHFHFAHDGILIRVEDNTTFSVSSGGDHEHEASWIIVQGNGTYAAASREVNWQDDNTLLLSLEQSDHNIPDYSDNIILELEANTTFSVPQTAYIFGVESSTETTVSSTFNWDDDIQLLSPEGVVNPGDLSTAGDGTFVSLEESTDGQVIINTNTNQVAATSTFLDTEVGGDVNRFIVTVDSSRNVFELDGIAQPAIQVPRGDIIEFDLTSITQRDSFVIFTNGEELTTNAVARFPTLLALNTSKIPRSITKAYYRHRTQRGMGWIIVITDN